MKITRARRVRRAALFQVPAVSVAAVILTAGAGGAVASPASGGANPIVRIGGGLVRGVDVAGVYSFLGLPYAFLGLPYAFLGLPYAAPPTGNLRWRPRSRRPRGRASGTRRSSGRAARSRR
jgi:para-nitrobenzyl esterase